MGKASRSLQSEEKSVETLNGRPLRALVITLTRELALQVCASVEKTREIQKAAVNLKSKRREEKKIAREQQRKERKRAKKECRDLCFRMTFCWYDQRKEGRRKAT